MNIQPRPPSRIKPASDEVIRSFSSETAEVLADRPPIQTRMLLGLVVGTVVLLLVVASLTSIDRVVTSLSGQLVTVEPTVVLQPLDPSIIRTLDVKEGERVRAGQLLATLDPTFTAADSTALKLQIASLEAQIARCEAELSGRPYMPPANAQSGAAALYVQMQGLLYRQRQATMLSELHNYDEQIDGFKATIVKTKADEHSYAARLKVAKQMEDMGIELDRRGFGRRVDLLRASDQSTEMRRQVEADDNSLGEDQAHLEATVAAREAYLQQFRSQTSQELVTARNQHDAAVEQLEKAVRHQDLVRLTAPQDGVVLGVAKLSVGSVIQPGDPLVELASTHSPLEAEIFIDPKDVAFVRPGDRATIKLDPYDFAEHGYAEGRLRWVSAGTFPTGETGTAGEMPGPGAAGQGGGASTAAGPMAGQPGPFYKARVTITKLDLKRVPSDRPIEPGMTLKVDIHVGKRSLFWYVVGGLVRGSGEAMRDP
jgi:HlyD family secretion protein